MPAPSPRSRIDRDPIAYANRPLDAGFDEYRAVREHVERLVIEPLSAKRPVSACPAS